LSHSNKTFSYFIAIAVILLFQERNKWRIPVRKLTHRWTITINPNRALFVYCLVFVHSVSAEQEAIITQIRHFSNYHVSCTIVFYIIYIYGWDLNFTSIINIYEV